MTVTNGSLTTTITTTAATDGFTLATLDLYRDIHKGIRAELFAVTSSAGSTDPGDRYGRLALADHITSVVVMLGSHAHHEDEHIDPILQANFPELASRISADHVVLDARLERINDIARTAVEASPGDQRRLTHLVYLELSGFTSAYLEHLILEERVVMPALEQAIGVPAVGALHGTILASIPPAEMAQSLAVMIPAMNLEDRVEMFLGMQMTAPPEAFNATVGIARSVLDPSDFNALGERLKVG